MHDIIQLLPDSIANQIAAGEVVQRPASVVKELVENAIDANATDIRVIIKDAGKQLIQVIDNGIGMSSIDARMCFERHATSKISKTKDLFSIRTMGFRGEAMASIAAVAQVELTSKRETDETGVIISIEGSILKKQEEKACNTGSVISVKNLFFNVPARRNFLKSNAVEMRHIIEEFQRTALAHPDISFALKQQDQDLYTLPAGKLIHRIIGVFGKNYRERVIPVHEEMPFLTIHGYLGKPQYAKKTRGEQFFFVNKRFIKSAYLAHAIMTALQEVLPKKHHPFYTLFFEIDPKHIDINVHPTKTEIKFDDERSVYAILNACVRKAIASHNLTPAIDFDHDINLLSDKSLPGMIEREAFQSKIPQKSGQEKSNLKHWEQLYEGFQNDTDTNGPSEHDLFSEKITLKSKLDEPNIPPQRSIQQSTMMLNARYILHQVNDGLMVIDPALAHQRILFDKYLAVFKSQKGASQQLLFPSTILLSTSDYVLVRALEKDLRHLGFMFECKEGEHNNALVLYGIPAGLKCDSEQDMFERFIEQYKLQQGDLSIEKHEKIAKVLAKKTAIKPLTKLEDQEINALLAQLFASQNPNYTPDGEPTLVFIDMSMISKMFR